VYHPLAPQACGACPTIETMPTDQLPSHTSGAEKANRTSPPGPAAAQPRIRIEYRRTADELDGVLAAVRFGEAPRPSPAPFTIDVRLTPLNGSPTIEAWLANGAVRTGTDGLVRYAHDDGFLFAAIELDEHAHGGVHDATRRAYQELVRFQRTSSFPHLLRIWNYLDAINEGDGDQERYRQFCVGRTLGVDGAFVGGFPAATAIGRQSRTGQLQVFWMAALEAGAPIENPRQVSAWRYPRTYGPASPTFSRATRTADGAMLISGTASIVGHASLHEENADAQLEETLRNLEALISQTSDDGSRLLFKVYLRRPEYAAEIERRIRQSQPHTPLMIFAADVCRAELLVEIEGVRLT